MVILGAGMAGCLAACIFTDATILEAKTEIGAGHQALLRFRSPQIGEYVGIEFKQVTVHKSIWEGGRDVAPSPRLLNKYSIKVAGVPQKRSISNLEPDVRWIAPSNFQQNLFNQVSNRTQLGISLTSLANFEHRPILSTIPIIEMARLVGYDIQTETKHWPIHVTRMKVAGMNVYQTIYFPGDETPVYRASITADTLIIESISELGTTEVKDVISAFGLERVMEEYEVEFAGWQKMGKIVPLDDKHRKEFLYYLSSEHNIWSLGRFACWRNILLDDVFKDIFKIRQMLGKTKYDIKKEITYGSQTA
jgi:hypothetical protein